MFPASFDVNIYNVDVTRFLGKKNLHNTHNTHDSTQKQIKFTPKLVKKSKIGIYNAPAIYRHVKYNFEQKIQK